MDEERPGIARMDTENRRGARGSPAAELRQTTHAIIAVFYSVANELGVGFLESVYREAMTIALRDAGLVVERDIPLDVCFRGRRIGRFRPDLLVERSVIVELKAMPALERVHSAQLINYLRASRIEVGLLLNFGPRAEIRRLLFDNWRKDSSPRTAQEVHRVHP